MRQRLRLPLATLAASLVLLGAYLLAGGAHFAPAAVPDPCHPKPWPHLHSRSEVAQRIGLSAVEGTACALHVSVETLTLALRSRATLAQFARAYRLGAGKIEDAIRAGLRRAVGDAENAGELNAVEAFVLDEGLSRLPVARLLAAARGLSLSW